VLAVGGCGGPKIHPSQTWTLPTKKSPDSAMIIGRIGMQNDKQRILRLVTFQRWGKVYFHGGTVPRGEPDYVMDNDQFVVPNLQPGRYYFVGFHATGVFNNLPAPSFPKPKPGELIELKPGEIRYVGSYDYIDGKLSTLRMSVGIPGSFSLKPAAKPSELDMLRWMLRNSNGSGWEPTIKRRIRELGARPDLRKAGCGRIPERPSDCDRF